MGWKQTYFLILDTFFTIIVNLGFHHLQAAYCMALGFLIVLKVLYLMSDTTTDTTNRLPSGGHLCERDFANTRINGSAAVSWTVVWAMAYY